MAKTKYSLAIERIDEAVAAFASRHTGYKVSIKNLNEGKFKQIEFTDAKSDGKGILNCYITAGQVSYNIQGSPKHHKIGQDCWESIVRETSLPDINQKAFKTSGVAPDDFYTLIEALNDYEGVEVTEQSTSKNPNVHEQYHLKGAYGARLAVTYYNNGTLLVQGAVTPFFVEFVTLVLDTITNVPAEAIKELFAVGQRTGTVFDTDIVKYISDLTHIKGSVIEKFILTSLSLANSGVPVDDYGCYTFSIIKALDGIITARLLEDVPAFTNYRDYFCKMQGGFGKYTFLPSAGMYDNNTRLKSALEQGYTFLHKHRHPTFHVDQPNIETSTILSYDEAVAVIKESLAIINDICNNW